MKTIATVRAAILSRLTVMHGNCRQSSLCIAAEVFKRA